MLLACEILATINTIIASARHLDAFKGKIEEKEYIDNT